MTPKKTWSMILSVAVAGSVARAQTPDSELQLSLDPPGISIFESVLEGSPSSELEVAAEKAPSAKGREVPALTVSHPQRIERSILETPRIEAVPVASPPAARAGRPKSLLTGHEREATDVSNPNDLSTAVPQPVGAAEMVRQRFANGKTQIERWVIEDATGNIVNHGKYVEYDASGKVVTSGNYALGKREGEWTTQITADQVEGLLGHADRSFAAPFTSRASFRNDQLDGEWTVADSKGRHLAVMSYQSGARNGTSTEYNAKGEVAQVITYKNNLADGPARLANAAGEAIKDTVATDGMILRQVDKWYPAVPGKPRVLQAQEWHLVSMPFNVARSDWANNSIEYQSPTEKEPLRHGRAVTFYANGQREWEGNYDHGKRTGTFAWWYPNGQQKTVGEYSNDAEIGQWTWWHENGIKSITGMFADGRKSDEWSWWDNDGKLVRRNVPTDGSQVAGRETSDSSQNR